eukprot:5598002-Pleurochrysis_carterae.AAC.1
MRLGTSAAAARAASMQRVSLSCGATVTSPPNTSPFQSSRLPAASRTGCAVVCGPRMWSTAPCMLRTKPSRARSPTKAEAEASGPRLCSRSCTPRLRTAASASIMPSCWPAVDAIVDRMPPGTASRPASAPLSETRWPPSAS